MFAVLHLYSFSDVFKERLTVYTELCSLTLHIFSTSKVVTLCLNKSDLKESIEGRKKSLSNRTQIFQVVKGFIEKIP